MPPGYEITLAIAQWAPAVFIAAFGACMGSLANVLVYRMPLGLGVVTPPSRCPHCETRLTWRENIPIFGWLLLRGRCRFCKSPISAEYPLVEAFTALLFGGLYALWFILPGSATLLGLPIGLLKPDWAPILEIRHGWPLFGLMLLLMFSLIVMTLIDAKTFTIPLSMAWLCAGAGILVHTGAALYVNWARGGMPAFPGGWLWTFPTPFSVTEVPMQVSGQTIGVITQGWWLVGASLGAMAGLGVSLLLLKAGLIHRSFKDYEKWETEQLAAQAHASASAAANAAAPQPLPPDAHAHSEPPTSAAASPTSPAHPSPAHDPTELWIAYPHARREMVRELAFLGPPVLVGIAAGYLADYFARPDLAAAIARLPKGATAAGLSYDVQPPIWLYVLCGSILGLLVGGGLVWLIRIFGTLAFGKEAMGLGDVHLMAGVGAIVGWIDVTLAFFAAAFVGMAWTIVSAISQRGVRRTMPYGPYLAIATVLVVVFKPLFEALLTRLMGQPINLPG